MLARVLAQKFNEAWKQPVVVENRAGAGGAIGTEIVARARPDGYTLLMRFSSFTTTPPFYPKLPYDSVRDFTPVTLVASTPNAIAALPGFPARNLQELIALAKSQPGKINYASSGTGTLPHLIGELLKLRAGIDLVHIPYKSVGPSMAAQFSGEVQLSIPALFSGAAYFKSGRLRALAVTSLKRAPALPEVATVDESGLSGFEAIAWYGVLAPAAMPRAIVDKIQREIARILAVPEFRDSLLAQHNEPVGSTPEVFALRIRSELDQWSKLVKQLGLKLEE
jgi:tripartite-type tricarboxylate transporter receptor subunit TctC